MEARAREEAEAFGEESLRRRLRVLVAARLLVALGVFGLALALVGAGQEGGELAERGLYGSLAFAFLVTAVHAAWLPRARRPRRLGMAQLAIDVAIVTSIVLFSGGIDSPFSFLYVPVAVYGAILFDRQGGYGAAGLSALGYALALAGGSLVASGEEFRSAPPWEVVTVTWAVHTSALLLVALLAGALSRDLRLAGERLEARTSDLARLRHHHARTVDCLTSGLLTLDREGRITSFNPEAERITGRSTEEVRGKLLDGVLPGASQLVEATHSASRVRRRLSFQDAQRDTRYLGIAVSILREEDGAPGGHVVIFQDVTDVVAMERDLRRSERLAAVGQLAADIAHEVRNPLAAISGCIEMLRDPLREHSDHSERGRLMEIVLREIERLNLLIGDFLRYARPAPPKLAPVELAPLLRDIGAIAKGGLPEGIALETNVPDGLFALADAMQLRQALWNLLTNAVQAIDGSGRVRVSASRLGEVPQGDPREDRNEGEVGCPGVELRVEDTGAGMSGGVLERIFDPFFTTKPQGTGLGLPTVHRIVEGHGGSVQVESRVGTGSCFRIWLPGPEEPH